MPVTTASVFAPRPTAPAPAASVTPYLFMAYNNLDQPAPKKLFLYVLEYPLICAAG